MDVRPAAAVVDDDAALMVRAAGGDVEAMSVLYDRHTPVLMAIAMRMLRQTADAEDVVHEVWIQTYQHAGDYDCQRGSVRAWLVVRARSRSLDRIRAKGRARTVSYDGAAIGTDASAAPAWSDKLTAPAHDPVEALENQRLRQTLARLAEPQRQLLELAYFDDLSMEEIAVRLGIPPGTVKSRLFAAREVLRGLLRSADDGDVAPLPLRAGVA